jgi:enoyl-CoA hydratase/3-hydroxyacyl-CoA dehydrogenase
VLVDTDEKFVGRGLDIISNLLGQGVERKVISPAQAEATMNRIQGTTELGNLAEADMVIEAVYEDEQVKKELFRSLDSICGEHTILATNTSSFYVADLAGATQRPDRFVGMHYFFHPAKNRLLEVIPHAATSEETVKRSLEIGRCTPRPLFW